MASVDLARLRNQTLTDGQDGEVTVNTRALIDKVLARYSSEHTTLRELIQNASDAGASTVVIRFETDPSPTTPVPQGADRSLLLKHVIQHHTLKRLSVSNNGQAFSPADWARLKSIADGNPDETKIGAFGVGFYSVFSDCDEPFVMSGDKTMAFYWKGNTLSTKTATVPDGQASASTTFFLDYRQANPDSPSFNPSKVPNLPGLCQFLATSLTFVGLESIELWLDGFKVASFAKKTSSPSEISIPQGLKIETEERLMRVTNVTRQHSQIDAEWSNVIATAQNPPKRAAEVVQEMKSAGSSALKSFFSKFSNPAVQPASKVHKPTPALQQSVTRTDDISGESKGIIFLQVCTVEATTRVTKTFAAEIERATKKPPPRSTRIALLTSPFHDPSSPLATGSGNTADLATKIFQEVLPSKAGRIFIGFPTAQTTPFLAHISAPSLIPTVERENVDMNARYIKTWNTELLRVAGLACRICYSLDMADIRDRMGRESISAVIPQAAYVYKQYTAKATHPSTVLGEKVVDAFFSCSKERAIAVLSTVGVKSSANVRMPAETLSFLRDVPMIPQELATQALDFFVILHRRGLISELTMSDIREGLDSRALSEEELIEFLKWCGSKMDDDELDHHSVNTLFDVTVANIGLTPDSSSGKILPLGSIRTYINASRIPPGLPVPADTIPFAFSKAVPTKQLLLFGWTELPMVRWLQFLTTVPQLQELTSSEQLAMQVLGSTAKAWDQIDNASKDSIVKILVPHAIMPTKMGMRRPQESYFPSVKLFDDLPTVTQFPGSKEKFLLALGVRKTVDLRMVFERMKSQDTTQKSEKPTWNHADLIRYFASVLNEIPKNELDSLRQTAFLPGEGGSAKPSQLYKAQDLYVPDPAVLDLGLCQVKLPFEFKSDSKEGLFLIKLGLHRYPDAMTLISIMHRAGKSNNSQMWTTAMLYYSQNYFKHGYSRDLKAVAQQNIAILPIDGAPFPNLVAPSECFTSPKAACLRFRILRADLRPHADKFGVRQDPDINDCVRRWLSSLPKNKGEAEEVFSYFGSRISDLDQHPALIKELSGAPTVPIFRKFYLEATSAGYEDPNRRQTGKYEYRIHHYNTPAMTFVGMDQDYKGIIDYVQYSPEATSFLLKVGAKHEPSSHDLASLLCQNPYGFLNTIGQDKYLDLLRKLSEHAQTLWNDKPLVKRFVASKVLLGYRDIKDTTKPAAEVEDDGLDAFEEADVHREWSLKRPNEVTIIDDVQNLNRFKDHIIAAPQEEQLEDFYARCGARKLSELVRTERRTGAPTRDQTIAQKLRKDILERVRLFLHDYDRDGSSKSIRHDAKWLAANLGVQCVSEISVKHSLLDMNVSVSSSRTAALGKDNSGRQMLNITPSYDLYDVSTELIRLLIKRPKRNDVIALERILSESLRRLQAKGINVERILRRKEYEARIAQQQEHEREKEEERLRAERAQSESTKSMTTVNQGPQTPGTQTPEKAPRMPGAFGDPDTTPKGGANDSLGDGGLLGSWTKKLFKNTPSPRGPPGGTNGPQISRDIQSTRSNISNAIKACRATSADQLNTQIHQDPTELDQGGYCSGTQYENLHKAFTFPHLDRHVDIYLGPSPNPSQSDLRAPLSSFTPLVFRLAGVFTVNPAAVNIFHDSTSNTVAFNMGGSLFFNLAWFMTLHLKDYQTVVGRQRAWDSWFLTFCHELAHNLVSDHNARHNWYNQQIAIEYSRPFREALFRAVQEVHAGNNDVD
ncbi:hypothetical protein M011DRAFT_428969 [Sporormia fimetaria CBS 119925]|uniref:Sacsin/Nov domain-containing protein n=1 Tax=Sporormia fimetaria CBS 119925 TaxID=1340428 RepID=A0A6A6V1S1_9PLEO|nr:hypothetical protein M011DRAFT_428969 [Sporormia fimetaria CBS 119925]